VIFWFLAAVLTAAILTFLLRPLFRAAGPQGIAPQDVYKAQLAEIEREAAAGLLPESDAASARTEIARRILRTGDTGDGGAARGGGDPRIWALVLAAPFVCGTLGFYLWLGRPDLPDQPYALRDLGAESAEVLGPAAQELERRLEEIDNPADRAILLGDAFVSLGGLDEAAQSYQTALSHRPDDPDVLTRLGEVELMRAQGLMTAGALDWVERALAVAPAHPAANFYRALYDYQQGDLETAEARLTQMLEGAPEDAGWMPQVEQLLAEVRGDASVADQADAIAGMDEEGRNAMIRSMVERLAARLEEEPDDFDGWLRLATSYGVLGEREAAENALSRARALAEGEPVLMRRVDEVASSLSQD
jgi:cytochrome c-type biogenesis protein CcmH